MALSGLNRGSELLAELAPPDQEESLFSAPRLGRYRLLACLGRGGMGDVFLGMAQGPAGFNKLAVVKQLRPHLADEPEYLAMFLDEARLAARFSHPNIVQTNEAGHDAGNRYFIAMEHLDGQSFDRVLHRAHPLGGLPLPLQLHVLTRVLDALHYAHGLKTYDGTPLGFVHRDVSPQNVFLTYQGECKVLDFGVAKAVGSTVRTQPGSYKGKLGYMAPEHLHGESVDRRADLFAVGVMLWTALAGRSPWNGMVNVEIGRRLFAGDIPSVRKANREVDAVLASICDRAMAPSPAARYQTADEMRTDLDAYLEFQGLHVTRKDLAEVLQKLFARDRTRMDRFVEEQIRRMGLAAAGDGEMVALPVVESPATPASAPMAAPAPGTLWAPRGQARAAKPGTGPWQKLASAALLAAAAAASAVGHVVLGAADRLKLRNAWLLAKEAARAVLAAGAQALRAAGDRLAPLAARCPCKKVGAAAAFSMLVAAAAAFHFLRDPPGSQRASAPIVVRIPAIELRASPGGSDGDAATRLPVGSGSEAAAQR